MSMKTRVSAYTLSVALVCSSGAFAQQKAEVLHWWTSAGESASVKVFADQFTKAGGTWVDNAIAGGVNARTAGINRMVGGNPPTMMQFNTGKQFDELVSNDLVRDVDAQAKAGKWREIMPKPIVDATVRNGKFYAVPVNIHGQNWMFYNTKIFADAGLQPPKTFPELIETGEKLKAKGVIPIALGGQPTWEHNLFRAVLVGTGGADMFRQFYGVRKPDVLKDPKFKAIRRALRQDARPRRPRQPRAQLERRHRPRDHQQGGHALQWRLGQGRVHGGGPDARQGIRLHPRGRQPEGSDRRRRLRLPGDQGQGSARRRRTS